MSEAKRTFVVDQVAVAVDGECFAVGLGGNATYYFRIEDFADLEYALSKARKFLEAAGKLKP